MRHVIGIDAGGTKTVGLLADETGQVLAEERGSGANLQTHGELEVEKVFDDIVEALAQGRAISAVALGIAGVDRPHDEAVIRGILRRLGHRENVRVVNDAAIALMAGAPDGVGIVVLAGTGSISYGQDRAGKSARAGGFGFLLADEGSGYWLGHQALRATVRAADGRGPDTRIMPIVFEALEVSSVSELVPRVYEKGLPKHRIAALASVLQRARDEGDVVAADLIDAGARELALAARAVARQLDLGDGPFPVVLAGGAFKACPSMVAPLEKHLDLTGARPAVLQVEPARGAVRLALDLLQS
jgi:N-acetylglucosamine kinase-like BadF-type ATPase